MQGAVVIRWEAAIPGREAKGLKVSGLAVARFEGFAKQSHISAHRECFGANGGFMLVERELTELTQIMTEEETLALNAKAAAIVQDFEIQLYGGGSEQAVQQLMGNYTAGLHEHGYM
jgi:SpoU rRNA methylase family enzyme